MGDIKRLNPSLSTSNNPGGVGSQKDAMERAIADVQSQFSSLFSVYGPDPATVPREKPKRQSAKGLGVASPAVQVVQDVPYVPRPPPITLDETILLLGGYENGRETSKIHLLPKQSTTWKQLTFTMPYVSAYHASVILNGELYVFGGESVHLYRLKKKNQWKKMANMRQKRSGITNSTVVLDGTIWVMGGRTDRPTNSVEAYDPERNEWNLMPSMIESRSGTAATVINGKIFVCGGWNGDRSLDSVEWYDPRAGFWSLLTALPSPCYGLSAVSDGSHLIVLGVGSGPDQKLCYRLDTEAARPVWQPLPSLHDSRHYFSVTTHGTGLVAVGGKNNNGSVLTLEFFDGFQWRDGPPLPKGFYGHSCLAVTQHLTHNIT